MEDHVVPDMELVSRILSAARMRTKATNFPELGALRMQAGLSQDRTQALRPYLLQQEVSLLLGHIHSRTDWYKKLEGGRITQPDRRELRRVSRLLDLSWREFEALHIALFGSRTMQPHRQDAGLAVAPAWNRVLHSSPMPAYISNRSWDVCAFNAAADELFGGMPDNILRSLFGLPHGRHKDSTQPDPKRPWGERALEQLEMLDLPPQPYQRRHMPDWGWTWGRAGAAGLRSGLADHPDDPILLKIHAEVRQDPELLDLYEGPVIAGAGAEDRNSHPDGTRRLMYHAGRDEVGVMEGAVSEPLGAPGARVVFMEWRPLEQASGICSSDCAMYHIHGS
ncbi:hypothetical protein ABZ851_30095 [Streptomyces sp. NPDC047049]|uniref:MmyB family transcriptional regulator n=1 Tax=Streptomyces sp. NPDC047049 TaxID=3156688 RepID=UPI0033C21AC4